MARYRFELEPYAGSKSRHICPSCYTPKTFTRYIDIHSGSYLASYVGRCDRAINCGYHLSPSQYFQSVVNKRVQITLAKQRPANNPHIVTPFSSKPLRNAVDFLPMDIFRQSLKAYHSNNLATYLSRMFSVGTATKLIEKFYLGTSRRWPGATVFWQIDTRGRIRTGKIMLYEPKTGKRRRGLKGAKYFSWAHAVLKRQGVIDEHFKLKQCLFGEHQLITATENLPIALVESEKTACIASLYFGQFIWMATGGLSNTSIEKFNPLAGSRIIMFPDLSPLDAKTNAFNKWSALAVKLQRELGCRTIVSDLLEKRASAADREDGLDLADYLVTFDWWSRNLTDSQKEFFEERAGIVEHHGRIERRLAEEQALTDVLNKSRFDTAHQKK